MKKNVIKCSKVITVLFIAVLLTSCHANIDWGNGIDGNGNVTTQNRNVENNFSKIDVSKGLNLTIQQSNNYSVEVEADDNLQEHITIRVENGTLIVTSDDYIDEAKAKNILVKLPSLTALDVSSGSCAKSSGLITGKDILVKSSSGSSTELSLEFDNIKCETSSGSKVNLKGKALQITSSSSSGSNIDAKKLLVNDVYAQASSGSTTDVHPIVSLNAKASSGSSVNYCSSPKTIVKEESSGGSVSNSKE